MRVGRETVGAFVCALTAAYAVLLLYCLTANVSTTTANATRNMNGVAISASPAPFIRIAREIVTKCRTGLMSDTVCTHGVRPNRAGPQ